MSYWSDNGKYQKAYDFLFEKLIPHSGMAKNRLGEALRLVNKAVYRYNNDGDSYDDCVHEGIIQELSKKQYPFDGEYHPLGRELDNLLSNNAHDDAINLVLFNIMLSLSTTTHIYNPSSNRLVRIDSEAGKKALKELNVNKVFINYCGKNEEWLPEPLRKDGVKISKNLSEETKKELKCDTITELHKEVKSRYNSTKKTQKLKLSQDNSILSKKFKKIESEHAKSVREHEKKRKERMEIYKKQEKREMKRKFKRLYEYREFYKMLQNINANTRVATIKKMAQTKLSIDSLIRMALITLDEYKEKKPTTADQKKHRVEVITKLIPPLITIGEEITETLSKYTSRDTVTSSTTSIDQIIQDGLDKLLVEIHGSDEAVDELWRKCCRH
jgi:hypothetical protein